MVLALVLAPPGAAQVAATKEAGFFKFEGKLSTDDPKDTQRETPCKVHLVKFKEGRVYTIDMVSTQFDSYLRLEDSKGNQLDEDDDSGGGFNARIIFNCNKAGEYKVICTTFAAQMSGKYSLTIKESVQVVKGGTPRQGLVGKPAPDFEAGFAINGTARRLADLKGQVVLLTFWDVQSAPCVATLPRLREWHKAYRSKGLAIVALTFYNFEIGQKLGFDRESGQFKRLAEASKATEQVMLQAFAAHHHLEFSLLAMPRREAVATFDAYVVNGVPQFVLIDRQGIVHSIRVGEDAATAAILEKDLKDVLAEK